MKMSGISSIMREKTRERSESPDFTQNELLQGKLPEKFELKESLRRNSKLRPTITLSWNQMSVFAKNRRENFFRSKTVHDQVLYKVTGVLLPGEMVALMGPSGSGKSTMLTVLGQRHQGNIYVLGHVKANGKIIDKKSRTVSGFLYQDDFFLNVLTVREHLMFMARLKMDRKVKSKDREERVDDLIESVGLQKVTHSRIGKPAAISGGEKRRLALATELLTLPKLIFADEPTTGLDSTNALRIISLMKSVSVSTEAAMLITIHQPMKDIFNLFDKVMLLTEVPVMQHVMISSRGFSKTTQMSDGEFLIECISPIIGSISQTQIKMQKLIDYFYYSGYRHLVEKEIEHIEAGHDKNDYFDLKQMGFASPTWCYRTFWLFLRGGLQNLRDLGLQWLAILQKTILASVLGICFFGATGYYQDGIQAIQGALFLLVTENTFAPMYDVLSIFPIEYSQITIEYSNGCYSISSYYIAKVFSKFPGLIIESLVFTCIVYTFAGLRRTLYAFGMICIYSVFCILVAASCGSFFSTAFDSMQNAITFLLLVENIIIITSGFFMRLSSIPPYASFLKYFSWLYYCFESMSIAQWDGIVDISCNEADPELQCMRTGEEVLQKYEFTKDHLLRNTIGLILLFLGFHFLGLFFFIRKLKNEK